jgi:hypothetical protein
MSDYTGSKRSWIDMPSDFTIPKALAAMAQPIAEFRSFVRSAIREAEEFRAEQSASDEERAARARVELGDFALGRIDPSRFATLFPAAPAVSPPARAALDRAISALHIIAEADDQMFVVSVPAGGRIGRLVEKALAGVGQAFGAAMLVDAVRGGRYNPQEHERLIQHEFRTWKRTVRSQVSPPLILSLHGVDLHAGILGEYADGKEKIVLLVRGPSAPAPLSHCITPGTLVLQTVDGSGLDRVAAFAGPAIAAVMPEGSAVFLHDPDAGREPWQRLAVHTLGDRPSRRIGGVSAWQMAEDQKLLTDLARTPFAIPVAGGPASPAIGVDDAVDRIASWLLNQSGLSGP